MKTILFLVLALTAVLIESARHHKSHKSHDDNHHEETTEPGAITDSDSTLPHPVSISNFPVPSIFVNDVETEETEQDSTNRHHSRKSHRAHKH